MEQTFCSVSGGITLMIPINMVDIHSHILPCIDDGPDSLQKSVEMAKIAYEEGIRTIVCTPHAEKDYDVLVMRAQDGLDVLQEKLQRENIPIDLLLGFEVRVNGLLLQYEHLEKLAFRLDGMKYMLLEFDFRKFPIYLEEILMRLRQENIQPILAHPERYPYLLENIAFLKNLINKGMLLQVNTGSITGEYGHSVQRFAKKIIQNGLAGFIATDTHSSRKRGPYVKQAGRLLESWASSAVLVSIYNHSV
jgi:protein-tyrosine phosphatase